MAEWLNAAVSKTVIPGNWYRGFESLPFRFVFLITKILILSGFAFHIQEKLKISLDIFVIEYYLVLIYELNRMD